MPDPDLEIKEGGGGGGGWRRSSRLLDKRRGGLQKKFFRALRPSVWSKNMGRAGGGWSFPRVPPLDPPLPGIMFIVSGGNPLPFPLSDSISTAEGLGYDSEVVK